MSSSRLRAFLGCCLAAIAAAQIAHGAERRFAGRALAEALQSLESDSLQFVFSSQVLPATLRVVTEPPAAASPIDTARTLLAPHGLDLRQLDQTLWAVVRPAGSVVATPAPPVEALQLAEMVISASRYRLGEVETGPSTVLAGETLAEHPGAGNDPLRAIDRLPGIASNGLSARANVRGGTAAETLLLLDGFPLRQPYHLEGYQGLFSVLDAGLVSSAEVFTGGFPARYGNRLSAVFELSSIDADVEPPRSVGLDFFNATLRGAGRAAGADWVASGRIGTLKPLLDWLAPDVGAPTYSDVYLKGRIGDPDSLRITGNVLWSRDELRITAERRGEEAQIEGRVRYAWLQAERQWTPDLQTSLWLGQTRVESLRQGTAMQAGVVNAAVDDARSARLTDLRGLLRWQPARNHFLEAGLDYARETARYRYDAQAGFAASVSNLFARAAERDIVAAVDPHRDRGALFASHRWQLGERLTSELGWRAQRLVTRRESGDWLNDPRFALRWEAAPRTRLHLNWGRVHQVAEINELAVEDGQLQFDDTQAMDYLIAGVEREVADGAKLRLEAYDKRQSTPGLRFENLLNAQTILPEVAPDRVALQPLRARLRGLELAVEYTRPQWSAWGSLAWSRAVDTFADRREPRSWDQPWTLAGGGRLRHGRWLHTAALELHRGWPTTPLLAASDGTQRLGARNSHRLPLFAQLDLRTEYAHPVGEGRVVLTGELMNAQVRANDCCSELQLTPGGGLGTRSLKWLPLMPSLGVRWEF